MRKRSGQVHSRESSATLQLTVSLLYPMETGIGTKSQQALKLQQEQNNQERKERSRKKKEAEEQRMFELKQQKKREKHKGH